MKTKKLGLPSVVATGVGLILATSCLMSLGLGSSVLGTAFIVPMILAAGINILTALSLSELNAVLPNLTGGLAQYTLACLGPFLAIVSMVGGYLVCNVICGSVETAMLGNVLNELLPYDINPSIYCIALLVVLMIANLSGVDMFAKVQSVVAYSLIVLMLGMGIIGIFGMGTGEVISQPYALSNDPGEMFSMVGLAFFLFLGCEYVIPIAKDVDKPRKNVPLGMIISIVLIVIMDAVVIFGMHNYTPWAKLGESTAPHLYYGTAMLGEAGMIVMAIVSILAVISTVNSSISGLSYICAGMAKINLLPKIFLKTNKKGAPYAGIVLISGLMILINATGLSTTDQLSFFILIGCVFWMVAYVIANLNVLILRRKLPKVARTFKVPLGPILPILGIVGNIFMIINIDGNPEVRMEIYQLCAIVFIVIGVFAVVWIKQVMKRPLFKPFEIKEVMAMENDLYHVVRENKESAIEFGRARKAV